MSAELNPREGGSRISPSVSRPLPPLSPLLYSLLCPFCLSFFRSVFTDASSSYARSSTRLCLSPSPAAPAAGSRNENRPFRRFRSRRLAPFLVLPCPFHSAGSSRTTYDVPRASELVATAGRSLDYALSLYHHHLHAAFSLSLLRAVPPRHLSPSLSACRERDGPPRPSRPARRPIATPRRPAPLP